MDLWLILLLLPFGLIALYGLVTWNFVVFKTIIESWRQIGWRGLPALEKCFLAISFLFAVVLFVAFGVYEVELRDVMLIVTWVAAVGLALGFIGGLGFGLIRDWRERNRQQRN